MQTHQPDEIPAPEDASSALPKDVANLDLKAKLLLLFMVALLAACAVFVLYARGAFDATQRLVLMAEDSEGVVVGMDLTFSGFPIGRVQRIELAEDGKARILVDVAAKDAHWLRNSSVFTLVKGIVGAPAIRAYSGIATDPPLPPNAVRTVLQGDASAEIPKVIAAAKDLIENLNALTQRDGPAGAVLANLQTTTERLNGPGGAMTVLLGSEAEAKKITLTLERTNQLLARLDGLAAKTDTQVFGEQGVMPQTKATVVQLNALLTDARTSLQKVDAVLKDAQAISANAKEASADLGALRGEVDASLRKVQGLMTEINRKWPFVRDTEIHLP
jgi:phospholipid/cholesterol/gamma-HCH transport system substrate-binding protein